MREIDKEKSSMNNTKESYNNQAKDNKQSEEKIENERYVETCSGEEEEKEIERDRDRNMKKYTTQRNIKLFYGSRSMFLASLQAHSLVQC